MMRMTSIQRMSLVLLLVLTLSACNFPFAVTVETQVPAGELGEGAAPSSSQDSESPAEGEQGPPTEEPPTVNPPTPTPTATTPPPTDTPEPVGCTDLATFVTDVTYPDDSEVESDTAFTKTWRLRNDGTCTWTSSYALVFSHGDQMSGSAEASLAGAVSPGSTVDISADLAAPVDPGTYQGFWKLRNTSGVHFGVGSGGSAAFWVKIVVPSDEPLVFEPLLPILEVSLLFQSSGNDIVLHDHDCFDLDEGEEVSCGAGIADFRYEHSFFLFDHEYEIDPIHGAVFKFFGSEAPTRDQCQAMTMSPGKFELNKRYYCYETTDGRFGWIHIDNYNSSAVLFDFGTFMTP